MLVKSRMLLGNGYECSVAAGNVVDNFTSANGGGAAPPKPPGEGAPQPPALHALHISDASIETDMNVAWL